jgi:glycosyltransferase involved in cell wall biosynthesis
VPDPGADDDLMHARIKVLRIIARLNIGGPARHAALLNEALGTRGLDTVLVYGMPDPQEGTLDQLVTERSLRSFLIPELGRAVKPWSDVQALLRLTRLVFRERPDVVHTHTAKAGALGRLAASIYNAVRRRDRRCLVVHTFHGHVLSGYFGSSASTAVRWIERTLARVTDRVVTISESQRNELAFRFAIAPRKKIVVIPLGLDLASLAALGGPQTDAKRRFGFDGSELVFGYIGRFVPIKDLETLLRAYREVARSSSRVRLLMLGDGQLRPQLEALARSLGVSDTVKFAGWQLDLPVVYSAIDVVVLSSLNEGTPVALIEGMAAGRPVVATAVGGVADIVEHERTGLLVPPREPNQLARAMSAMAASERLRIEMGAAGRQEALHRFRIERLASDVEALYRNELSRKRQS